MSKETIVYVKRDYCICQKRLLYMSKETFVYVKRDYCICQKRPTIETQQRPVYATKRVIKETHAHTRVSCSRAVCLTLS